MPYKVCAHAQGVAQILCVFISIVSSDQLGW